MPFPVDPGNSGVIIGVDAPPSGTVYPPPADPPSPPPVPTPPLPAPDAAGGPEDHRGLPQPGDLPGDTGPIVEPHPQTPPSGGGPDPGVPPTTIGDYGPDADDDQEMAWEEDPETLDTPEVHGYENALGGE